jgi:hypothetical protein
MIDDHSAQRAPVVDGLVCHAAGLGQPPAAEIGEPPPQLCKNPVRVFAKVRGSSLKNSQFSTEQIITSMIGVAGRHEIADTTGNCQNQGTNYRWGGETKMAYTLYLYDFSGLHDSGGSIKCEIGEGSARQSVPHTAPPALPARYGLNLRERLAKPLAMGHLGERFALLLPLTDCMCRVAERENG